MLSNEQPFHLQARKARLNAGLSQMELAAKVGCRQSQISTFEAGISGKISRETLGRIAETLGIAAPAAETGAENAPGPATGAAGAVAAGQFGWSGANPGAFAPSGDLNAAMFPAAPALAYCPDCSCLSNMPYFMGGELRFLPLGLCGAGARCTVCGEVLERRCPHCKAPVRGRGGCCAACGGALMALPQGAVADVESWVRAQRAAVSAYLAAFTGAGPWAPPPAAPAAARFANGAAMPAAPGIWQFGVG